MESVENLSRQQYRVRGAVDGFPPFPPPLGNRYAIPTVPQPRRRRYLSYEQETQGDTSIELPRGTFLLALTRKPMILDIEVGLCSNDRIEMSPTLRLPSESAEPSETRGTAEAAAAGQRAGAKTLVHVLLDSAEATPAGSRVGARELCGRGARALGPTLASEHLAADHGLEVPRETLRRWMLAAGLWSRRRKRQPHRTRRQRKAHFGELIQLDGSHHHWLEERGPKACLMNFVDDATGDQETTWAAADLLAAWVRQHGVPKAGKTSTSASRRRGKRWQASSPRRSSGACVPSSALRSWRLPRRKPRAEWSAITARTKTA